jgi:hypothetical protein
LTNNQGQIKKPPNIGKNLRGVVCYFYEKLLVLDLNDNLNLSQSSPILSFGSMINETRIMVVHFFLKK